MFLFEPLYLLLIVPTILVWYAQAKVRQVYRDYAVKPNVRQANGLEIARLLLLHYALIDVSIERVPGYLTDHYHPETRILHLSHNIANNASVTALGIVAHEVGHAVQYEEGYRLAQVRTRLAGIVGQAARWSPFVFLGGAVLGNLVLMWLGGLMLAALTIFALVTLPVERDASNRALAMLRDTHLAVAEENQAAGRVLGAAALTYLAELGRRLAFFLFAVLLAVAIQGAR